MAEFSFKRVEANEVTPVVTMYINANVDATDAQLKRATPDQKRFLVVCSDGRVEEDQLVNALQVPYIVALAGNVVKDSINVPQGVEYGIIASHEHAPGVGCGASGVKGKVEKGEIALESLSKSLQHVGINIHSHTRKNAIERAAEVAQEYNVETIPTAINHVTGELTWYTGEQHGWVDNSGVTLEMFGDISEGMKTYVQDVIRGVVDFKDNFTGKDGMYNFSEVQDPLIAAFTYVGPTASDLVPGPVFNGANTVFEVKPGVGYHEDGSLNLENMVTPGALGSLEYIWGHATPHGHGPSFNRTTNTIALFPSSSIDTALTAFANAVKNNTDLETYMNNGGKVYAIGVSDTNRFNISQVYELH